MECITTGFFPLLMGESSHKNDTCDVEINREDDLIALKLPWDSSKFPANSSFHNSMVQ